MNRIRRLAFITMAISVFLLAGCSGGSATQANVPNTGGNPIPGNGTGAPGIKPGTVLNVPAPLALPSQRQPVNMPANTASVVETMTLQPGQPVAYQVRGIAGKHMYLAVNGDAKYQVYAPGDQALSGVIASPGPVGVVMNTTGDYTIVLSGQGSTTMSVYIPQPGSSDMLAAPIPAALKPLAVQPGGAAASDTLNLAVDTPQGYQFTATYDQTLTVKTTGNATVTLITPDKNVVVAESAPPGEWQYSLPEGGKYTLVLFGNGPVQVSASLSPSAGGQPTPIPLPASSTRMTIPSGQTTVTQQVTLASGAPQAFVVPLQPGQELNVLVSGQSAVTIYGPGGSILPLDHPQYTASWTAPVYQSGDYTVVVSGSGPTTITFYVPSGATGQ